jgi:hypothetical protein
MEPQNCSNLLDGTRGFAPRKWSAAPLNPAPKVGGADRVVPAVGICCLPSSAPVNYPAKRGSRTEMHKVNTWTLRKAYSH